MKAIMGQQSVNNSFYFSGGRGGEEMKIKSLRWQHKKKNVYI